MSGTPMLQAAKLWEKTSAAGNVYLIGRLGGVRILILRNRDAGAEGEPDFHLFFADGAPRQEEASGGTEPRRRPPYRRQQREMPPPDPRPFDDALPEL